MSDDSDYVPDYDEEAGADDDFDAYADVAEEEDTGYLTGATTATDDEGSDIFDDEVDPFTLLQSMEQTVAGEEEAEQPYEVLRANRARNRKLKVRLHSCLSFQHRHVIMHGGLCAQICGWIKL